MVKVSEGEARKIVYSILGPAAKSGFLKSGRGLYKNRIKLHPLEMIELASSDPVAFEATKEVCADMLQNKQELPEAFKQWLIGYLKNPEGPKNRRHKEDNFFRNTMLVWAVFQVKDKGYTPVTKNDTYYYGRPCACDIVAEIYSELSGENVTPASLRKLLRKYEWRPDLAIPPV